MLQQVRHDMCERELSLSSTGIHCMWQKNMVHMSKVVQGAQSAMRMVRAASSGDELEE